MNTEDASKTDRIISSLKKRRILTCLELSTLFDQFGLSKMMEGQDWAVVGGAVRDVLISDSLRDVLISDPLLYKGPTSFPWTDVDVALICSEQTFDESDHLEHLGCEFGRIVNVIGRNRLGGTKLYLDDFDLIDLWCWYKKSRQTNVNFVRSKLRTVDFGLNAVAFLWDECGKPKTVIHSRWKYDLQHRQVETMPMAWFPDIYRLISRAIVLAAGMYLQLGVRFQLGDTINNHIRDLWLNRAGDLREMNRILLEKIERMDTKGERAVCNVLETEMQRHSIGTPLHRALSNMRYVSSE